MNNVFIWGMGLLGASLAYDLKKQGRRVTGCVRSEQNLDFLYKTGFHEVFLTSQVQQVSHALAQSDVVVLAVPVIATREVLTFLADVTLKPGCIITDMGSTKGEVMQLAKTEFSQLNFTGSHPMAGSELSGPQHAQEDLFKEATVYVVPGLYPQTDDQVTQFWLKLGSHVMSVDALTHDRWLAFLSHGLHLLSCASVHLLKEIPEVLQSPVSPAAGSFRDISRVAASNPALWKTIIDSNRDEVVSYLSSLESLIGIWKSELSKGRLNVAELFDEAGEIRAKVVQNE